MPKTPDRRELPQAGRPASRQGLSVPVPPVRWPGRIPGPAPLQPKAGPPVAKPPTLAAGVPAPPVHWPRQRSGPAVPVQPRAQPQRNAPQISGKKMPPPAVHWPGGTSPAVQRKAQSQGAPPQVARARVPPPPVRWPGRGGAHLHLSSEKRVPGDRWCSGGSPTAPA